VGEQDTRAKKQRGQVSPDADPGRPHRDLPRYSPSAFVPAICRRRRHRAPARGRTSGRRPEGPGLPLWSDVRRGRFYAPPALWQFGAALFPSTKGYPHFQFSDYGKLTVIGVIIASAAWPVVTRIANSTRWLYLRLAILVTLFLWLPDLYILAKGQPPAAVAVLMVMHVAIAVVTYSALVHLAAVPERTPQHSRL
jgi:hypothetical protein